MLTADFILAVASFIGKIVFLIKINSQNIIIEIANIFVIKIEIAILFTNLYSRESLSLRASRTFQKLSVGIISSIYFGAIPLLTR
ncbi:hypothetical protein HOF65_03500 [bacterium]|nr:hypothetical protein [bacterium]MBT3853051.1 hypothetical protein [bacterium]MBT4633316.1 hypothetical protein [bacterium]MBT6779300.1 hypothetical protein [bacterium]